MTGDLNHRTLRSASSTDGASAPKPALEEAHESEQNRLLRALPLEDYAHVLPHLRPARLVVRDVLVQTGAPIEHVYFVRSGAASVIAGTTEGGSVEIAAIGHEGLVGTPLIHGVDRMPFEVFVQIQGEAWRLDATIFSELLEDRPAVRARLQCYAEYLTVLLGQSAACNRLHTIEERCARWLLMTDDQLGGEAFDLTHEYLALMLGVRRAGVTVAMGVLQRSGVLTYRRSRISIIDRPALALSACDCYGITQLAMTRLLG